MSQLEELPKAIISRIIRNKLPENVAVAKDAKTAISQAASVFILYVTATAHDLARNSNRTTVTATDVIEAMKELEFDDFVGALEEARQACKKEAGKRKKATAATKAAAGKDGASSAPAAASAAGAAVAGGSGASADGTGASGDAGASGPAAEVISDDSSSDSENAPTKKTKTAPDDEQPTAAAAAAAGDDAVDS